MGSLVAGTETSVRKASIKWHMDTSLINALLMGSLDAVYVLHAIVHNNSIEDFQFVEINETAEAHLGLPRDQIIGNCFTKLIKQRCTEFFNQCMQVFLSQKMLEQTVEVLPDDIAPGIYRQRILPLPYGVVIINRLLQETSQPETTFRQSESRLTEILESVNDVLWSLDYHTGRVLYVSQSVETLTGYSPDEIYRDASLWTRIIVPEDFQHVHDALLNTPPQGIEFRITRKDGVLRWMLSRIHIVRDEHGGISRWDGIVTDITDRKQAALQALDLEVERHRTQVLSEFIRDASHEFRTPLSVINLKMYLLEKQTAPAQQARHIAQIRQQIETITSLIEGLLTMSRLDTIGLDKHEVVHLNEIVKLATVSEQNTREKKGLSLALNMADTVNDSMLGDPAYLHVALVELIRNAVRYTPDGGDISITVEVDDTQHLLVTISDNGVGIPAEHVPFIFNRFYRVENMKTNNGLGLGLAIVRKVVELHEGTIHVQSEPGRGSQFTVRFPPYTA
jgi:PAS domain S-box-containing protein